MKVLLLSAHLIFNPISMFKIQVLFFLFIFSFLNTKGQAIDSTQIKIEQLRTATIFMRESFAKSHREFRAGFLITLAGSAATTILISSGSENKGLLIGSSALSFIGLFIMIDSHKFIGEAGRWRYTPTSITMDF